MRLLMLNYEFPPIGGGAGNANLCLLREYARRAEPVVDVLTSAPEPGFCAEDLAPNIRIRKVGVHKKDLHHWRRTEVIEWLIKARRHYRRLLQQNDYDLVHAFFGFPTGYLCYRTADKLPYVISLRGSDVPGYNVRLGLDYKLTAGLFRRIWSRASAVVANSAGLRELAGRFMPELRIEVIPNGVDTERFRPAADKQLGQPARLLTVGRLTPRKRIDLLIRAVQVAVRNGLNVELEIAGDGHILPELRRLAARLGLAERVAFLQRVPAERMPGLYRASDIFVMSSAHEGMSNAMLEAMASGLPIVTTACEGTAELVAENGIVLHSADPEAIAAALGRLVRDEGLWRRTSAASRKRAERFSWAQAAEDYLACYRRIIEPRAGIQP